MTSPLFESGAKGDVGVEKASPARERVMRMYFILGVGVVDVVVWSLDMRDEGWLMIDRGWGMGDKHIIRVR